MIKNVRYVDAGPSGSKKISALKEKFGFKTVKEWREKCSYTGPFLAKMPPKLNFSGESKSWLSNFGFTPCKASCSCREKPLQ